MWRENGFECHNCENTVALNAKQKKNDEGK